MIDEINIRQATHSAMHEAENVVSSSENNNLFLLIDGNDFKPYLNFTAEGGFEQISRVYRRWRQQICCYCCGIILAKVERDRYISEICEKDPTLEERYDLLKNKGYGTKKHGWNKNIWYSSIIIKRLYIQRIFLN